MARQVIYFSGAFLLGIFILIIAGCATHPRTDNAGFHKESPNILLICADDLGWSDIGCYGSEVNTPNLDQLAAEGMRFTQFHNTSKCFPSRATLITGVYAQDCGYAKSHKNVISNAVTIGEVLSEAGYHTWWSGKHHGMENPVKRGFDHYYGLKDGACNYFNPGKQRVGEPKPAKKNTDRVWCFDEREIVGYTPEDKEFYTTDKFTDAALEWLGNHADSEDPFFLYVAYTAPHDPLMAWSEDIRKYDGRYDQGYESIRKARYKKQRETGLIDDRYSLSEPDYDVWAALGKLDRADEIRRMEVYAAMIDRLDQNIGRLLNELRKQGKLDKTLVMFVSDNGASAEVVSPQGLRNNDPKAPIGSIARWESLRESWANVGNTPFRYYKNYSYEGGTNTPFIVRWPPLINANTITEFPGHLIDIMPTIVELTRASYPQAYNGEEITPMRGQSLVPVFAGNKISRERDLFWEWGNGAAYRRGKWKIIKHGSGSAWELYDMEDDPTETVNLANRYPEILHQLAEAHADWKRRFNESG